MSEWGIIYEHQTERELKRKGGHKATAELIEAMSTKVIEQDREIRDLGRKVSDLKDANHREVQNTLSERAQRTELEGYIARVREEDERGRS